MFHYSPEHQVPGTHCGADPSEGPGAPPAVARRVTALLLRHVSGEGHRHLPRLQLCTVSSRDQGGHACSKMLVWGPDPGGKHALWLWGPFLTLFPAGGALPQAYCCLPGSMLSLEP